MEHTDLQNRKCLTFQATEIVLENNGQQIKSPTRQNKTGREEKRKEEKRREEKRREGNNPDGARTYRDAVNRLITSRFLQVFTMLQILPSLISKNL
jgi:hypothetical protein